MFKNFSIEDFGMWAWTGFFCVILPISLAVGIIRWAFG